MAVDAAASVEPKGTRGGHHELPGDRGSWTHRRPPDGGARRHRRNHRLVLLPALRLARASSRPCSTIDKGGRFTLAPVDAGDDEEADVPAGYRHPRDALPVGVRHRRGARLHADRPAPPSRPTAAASCAWSGASGARSTLEARIEPRFDYARQAHKVTVNGTSAVFESRRAAPRPLRSVAARARRRRRPVAVHRSRRRVRRVRPRLGGFGDADDARSRRSRPDVPARPRRSGAIGSIRARTGGAGGTRWNGPPSRSSS